MPARPELQRVVQERTRELQAANEALRETEQTLAIELDTTERLQHVATQLMSARGTSALYEQILDTALAILHADFASIQKFYPERGINGELRLLGHRGFNAQAPIARQPTAVRGKTNSQQGEFQCQTLQIAAKELKGQAA